MDYDIAHLEEIRKVDKHVGLGLLLSARDIEAYGDDVQALAALCELVFDGEGVKACCSEADGF